MNRLSKYFPEKMDEDKLYDSLIDLWESVEKSIEVFYKDPLGEVTRRERRSLLIASVLGLIIYFTGMVPEKFEMVGIIFTESQKSYFIIILQLVIIYFILIFSLYAYDDFKIYKSSIDEYNISKEKYISYANEYKERISRPMQIPVDQQVNVLEQIVGRATYLQDKKNTTFYSSVIRIFMDLILAPLLGIISIIFLFFKW